MSLVLHPEHHPRFGSSFARDTDIIVSTDAEDGEGGYRVTLSIELEWGEELIGPGDPWREEAAPGEERRSRSDEERALHVATAVGDLLHRSLEPSEARELAAALWHQADVADRARRP